MKRLLSSTACLTLLALQACSTTATKLEQLEDVAKDWSYVVRASQVMPIYPLTEDLFPGDVFLVQTPIDQQQQAWQETGYLPLDNHVARLDPDGYEQFYDRSFDLPQASQPPKVWLTDSVAWSRAPRAAFPTYSFQVKSGYGLSGALPIQGVPVGLSLLGAQSAYGTVTLADARTYGTDIASLYRQLEEWARKNRDLLASFASNEKRTNYLRVVTRVYLVGRVAVTIESQEARGAGVQAGVPKPVELLIPERAESTDSEAAVKAYGANLEALNKAIEKALTGSSTGAGATFQITAASARSVSMAETFPRPLVIGYLGFDAAMGEGGALGPPVPTYAVVNYGASPALPDTADAQLTSNARMQTAARALEKMAGEGNDRARRLLEELNQVAAVVPAVLPVHFYDSEGKITERRGKELRAGSPSYWQVSRYRGGLLTTIANLTAGRDKPDFKLAETPEGVDARAHLASELAAARRELEVLHERLAAHARLFYEVDRITAPYEVR
ncbi:MAG TPA: hypothetical protein VK081_14405 [Planctomycetota bacterium]|nr:hypothetical protein [Planctomycetota bacterium]